MAPGPVQLLSDHVANKIAAGEVVDRPASVVKELMENALDAGSTQIDVEVVDGGKKLVAVQDNGCGMSKDDMLMSLERHATSKIRDVDDIEAVATMGFRGEALAAIASVSRFVMTSRLSDELGGQELSMYGGTLQGVDEVGCPVGTRITVRNLFFNVPARRKFLRADATELSHIRQIFLLMALANPAIGLKLTVDEREIHNLPADDELSSRLRRLYNPDFVTRLLPLEYESGEVRIHGLAGRSDLTRSDRSDQHYFVNRRPASAASIYSAVRDGFKGLVPRDRHPVLFLFIELDPDQVDVNVHPTKKEVRLRRPREVHDGIVAAVQQAFQEPAQSLHADAEASADGPPKATPPPEPVLTIEDLPDLPVVQYPRWTQSGEGSSSAGLPFRPADESGETATTPDASSRPLDGPWTWCRILGQIGGRYVAMETEDGLVMMNPRAATERVLYEEWMKAAGDSSLPSQGLLSPQTVQLNPKDAETVRSHMETLQAMGFGISDFGGDCFLFDALPQGIEDARVEDVMGEILAEWNVGSRKDMQRDWLLQHAAQAAVRAAVRGLRNFSVPNLERLVSKLAQCDMPYTTPDGRPTLILNRLNEWKRKFGDS